MHFPRVPLRQPQSQRLTVRAANDLTIDSMSQSNRCGRRNCAKARSLSLRASMRSSTRVVMPDLSLLACHAEFLEAGATTSALHFPSQLQLIEWRQTEIGKWQRGRTHPRLEIRFHQVNSVPAVTLPAHLHSRSFLRTCLQP